MCYANCCFLEFVSVLNSFGERSISNTTAIVAYFTYTGIVLESQKIAQSIVLLGV